MKMVAFFIDGWFMRKRIYQTKAFYYNGAEIRKYASKHLNANDEIFRIFYYDSAPLKRKGHNPITGKGQDFSKTNIALQQEILFDSLRRTPNVALRLGTTVWNKEWSLNFRTLRDLFKGKTHLPSLKGHEVSPVIRQKSVDMKIGLDIATLAYKGLAEKLIIITGDQDFVPALKHARKEGLEVVLDPLWAKISPDLREHVDRINSHI